MALVAACRSARHLPRTREFGRAALSALTGPLSVYDRLVDSGRLRADPSQRAAAQSLERFACQQDDVDAVYLWGSVGSGKSMLMDLLVDCNDCRRLHFHELMVDIHQQLHALHMARPKKVVLTEQGLPIFKFGDAARPVAKDVTDVAVDATDAVDGGDGQSQATPSSTSESEPLTAVIESIASRTSLLCLDEMQVTDVADAMLLRQLFEGLFSRGVRAVFTSNRPPEELYERGLNRKYFLPFVSLLRQRAHVLRVGGAGAEAIDYRSLRLANQPAPGAADTPARQGIRQRPRGQLWHGSASDAQLLSRWATYVSSSEGRARVAAEVPVAFGRQLPPHQRSGDACLFTFHELCCTTPGEPALGASDYLALASSVRCVFLHGVPVLQTSQRNEVRRLVALIDVLYEARTELHVAAAAPLARLFTPLLEAGRSRGEFSGGAEVEVGPSFAEAPVAGRYNVDGELAAFFTAKDEAFMVRRTLSRLTEMCEEQAA